VILQATIDTKGDISTLKVVQGDPILAEAAAKAVKQWRYRPYVLNGKPVEVEPRSRSSFTCSPIPPVSEVWYRRLI
jgi:protein TonB